MQLTFDAEVETFRSELAAILDEDAPADADALVRPRSSSHVPVWAREWQRLLFDNGWLVPGNPPEFGGRSAGIMQQYVHQRELARRRMVPSFNSQGVGSSPPRSSPSAHPISGRGGRCRSCGPRSPRRWA